ncbi:MAG: DUF3095 family protein [Ardenticatenales bacterium]|nr:DUF3095 family protein [Ardenticatenales bacterium]
MTENFYSLLAAHEVFLDVTDPETFTPVPSDWCIAIADIQGSTYAIQAGRYKEVNMVGAASIVALLNIEREIELPFLFGGDGATILLPPSLGERAKAALLGTQQMAKREFDLELRVALISVSRVLEAGQSIGIAKFKISENYEQAMFTGGGLAYAEQLLKNPATTAQYSGFA